MGKKGRRSSSRSSRRSTRLPDADEDKFTKTDMERLGLFSEGDYISIGDPYISAHSRLTRESAYKGKQMLGDGTKTMDETQAGYFQKNFLRMWAGEGYSDPLSLVRQYRMRRKHKNLRGPFHTACVLHMPCGLGSFCDTINPCPPAMSRLTRDVDPGPPIAPNLTTSPGKTGTGYGYPNLTIGKYPEWKPDSYDAYRDQCLIKNEKYEAKALGGPFFHALHPKPFFGPNPYDNDNVKLRKIKPEKKQKGIKRPWWLPVSPGKLPGGMKAGTFNPYPAYMTSSYNEFRPYPKNQVNSSGLNYFPSAGPKTTVQNSIMFQNVIKHVNAKNYQTVKGVLKYGCPLPNAS